MFFPCGKVNAGHMGRIIVAALSLDKNRVNCGVDFYIFLQRTQAELRLKSICQIINEISQIKAKVEATFSAHLYTRCPALTLAFCISFYSTKNRVYFRSFTKREQRRQASSLSLYLSSSSTSLSLSLYIPSYLSVLLPPSALSALRYISPYLQRARNSEEGCQ